MNKLMNIAMIGVVLALSSLPFTALAGPGFGNDVIDGVDCPIDGGLSLLAAAGIGYGAKKILNARKKQKETRSEL